MSRYTCLLALLVVACKSEPAKKQEVEPPPAAAPAPKPAEVAKPAEAPKPADAPPSAAGADTSCPEALVRPVLEKRAHAAMPDGKIGKVFRCAAGKFPKPGWYAELEVTLPSNFVQAFGGIIEQASHEAIAADYVVTLSKDDPTKPEDRVIDHVTDSDHDGIDEVYFSGVDRSHGMVTKVVNEVSLKAGKLVFTVITP